jgi:hypothetical protein
MCTIIHAYIYTYEARNRQKERERDETVESVESARVCMDICMCVPTYRGGPEDVTEMVLVLLRDLNGRQALLLISRRTRIMPLTSNVDHERLCAFVRPIKASLCHVW